MWQATAAGQVACVCEHCQAINCVLEHLAALVRLAHAQGDSYTVSLAVGRLDRLIGWLSQRCNEHTIDIDNGGPGSMIYARQATSVSLRP